MKAHEPDPTLMLPQRLYASQHRSRNTPRFKVDAGSLLNTICKLIGVNPLDNDGTVSRLAVFMIIIYSTISCLGIVNRIIQLMSYFNEGFSSADVYRRMSSCDVFLAVMQTAAILVYVINILYKHVNDQDEIIHVLYTKRDLSVPLDSSIRDRFGEASLVVSVFLMVTCSYSAYNMKPKKVFYVAILTLNAFQDFCIALQCYYFVQRSRAYLLNRKGSNLFKSQHTAVLISAYTRKLFEIPLLLIYGNSFGFTVWYLYKWLLRPVLFEKFVSFSTRLYYVLMLVQKALTMLLPCMASQQFHRSMDEHYDKLFRLMRDNPSLCKKSSLFLYVTTKYKVKLTVCGFFSLGYPLITSIIAGCATYLIVLIQFSR